MTQNRRWKQITFPLRIPPLDGSSASKSEQAAEARKIWRGEHSYTAYRRVLKRLLEAFPANYLIGDIPQIISQIHQPKMIIRHDVVHSLDKALQMARLESQLRVKASYLIRFGAAQIRTDDPTVREQVNEIQSLGHEIGLNVSAFSQGLPSFSLEQFVQAESTRLARILNVPIRSVSFPDHLPGLPYGSLFLGTMVHATSSLMMKWALRDSDKQWTIAPPRPAEQDPDRALMQLVIRPEIWSERKP